LLERIAANKALPASARELFERNAREYAWIETEIDVIDNKLMAWHRSDECRRRLAKI